MNLALFIGAALCAVALLQCSWWVASAVTESGMRRRQWRRVSRWLRTELIDCHDDRTAAKPVNVDDENRWAGYRELEVAAKREESPSCVSVYLKPADGKPLARFRPGQHLVAKFRLPGRGWSATRCYTISSPPGQDTYRITVKRNDDPAASQDAPQSVSRLIHTHLQVGDCVMAKAPAGHFFLDPRSPRPIVMLAAGIGITPMISMLESMALGERHRPVMLLYGVRDGSDHSFQRRLDELAKTHDWLTVVHCYSRPRPETDREGVDYHVAGRIDVAWLKRLLPHHRCDFYLCGPAAFMQSAYDGLLAWGVAPEMIHFESFGPSTVRRTNSQQQPKASGPSDRPSTDDAADREVRCRVSIQPGDHHVDWNGDDESILELAERHSIPLDSGCRSGQCGTCALRIASGRVEHADDSVDVEPGECLACIARPLTDVVLEVPCE